jgi:AcrR family transcriptional regulator
MDLEEEKKQKKSDTQDEILRAALKLFTEKGYFNTSLIDIKDVAGVKTTSGIYQHFKNKQAIASALYQNILDSLSCSIDEIRRKTKEPDEQLREVVELMFGLTGAAPEVMRFLLVLNIVEFLPEETPLLETKPFQKIIKILQAGIKAGKIRDFDPLQAYTFFFGVINSTLTMVMNGSLKNKAEQYESITWQAAWKIIVK